MKNSFNFGPIKILESLFASDDYIAEVNKYN